MESTKDNIIKRERGVRSSASKIAQAKRRKNNRKEKMKCNRELKKQAQCSSNAEIVKLRRENHILKGALESMRKKAYTNKSSHKCTMYGTKNLTKLNHIEAKKALLEAFPSMPTDLMPDALSAVIATGYSGSFGSISVVRYSDVGKLVAQKEISISRSSELDILAEVRVSHALAGHRLFPYCYGFLRPNLIVYQLLGTLKDNTLNVYTLDKIKLLQRNEKYLSRIAFQLVEGIQFMHNLNLLHNDIKANNAIVYGPEMDLLKVIDFGKCTLISNPEVYNLSVEQREFYNKKHRYLAYELRNRPNAKQTVLTDTYSVGYLFKHLGVSQSAFLCNVGEKMSYEDPCSRCSLDTCHRYLKTFLSDLVEN